MATSPIETVSLTGTLPVKPFGDQFYGTIEADGQEPKVAALACETTGKVVLLSLVGYDTSCSAALATLFLAEEGKSLRFRPTAEIDWQGPTRLPRCVSSAKQLSTVLAGTRERHHVALAEAANIHLGLLFPPELPEPEKPKDGEPQQRRDRFAPTVGAQKAQPPPRYLLGNGQESTPNREAFLGQLRALRVIHAMAWAEALWQHGLEQALIVPLPALGVRCWSLEGNLLRWGAFLSQGLAEGWLSDPEPSA